MVNYGHTVVTRFEVINFGLLTWDAVLFGFSVGEEFSLSVWGRFQPSILRSLGTYWFLTLIPANDGWGVNMMTTCHPQTGYRFFHLCTLTRGRETIGSVSHALAPVDPNANYYYYYYYY